MVNTAGLIAHGFVAEEDRSQGHRNCRILTKERKRIDKNEKYEKDSKTNLLRMQWNFYRSNIMINKKFINNNQLIWILNAKDMIKINQVGQKNPN